MKWHHLTTTAAKPPTYVLERISDLVRVADVAKTSPSNARSLLRAVLKQLLDHMDDDYSEEINLADSLMIDNPKASIAIIESVAEMMRYDKRTKENAK